MCIRSWSLLVRVAVRKWGNSLGIRIPQAFAKEVQIDEGTEVDLTIEGASIVLTPKPTLSLSALLNAVTDDNRHAEIGTGKPAGRESW
jgi:antitoxin MazE